MRAGLCLIHHCNPGAQHKGPTSSASEALNIGWDHDDPALKRSGFRINLAKPRPGEPTEANGPVYPWRSLRECQEAPVTASHFRFARVEAQNLSSVSGLFH